jgi:hypothetical protein
LTVIDYARQPQHWVVGGVPAKRLTWFYNAATTSSMA